MKRMKKALALLLAAVLSLGMTIASLAEGGAGTTFSITINNTVEGHTYEVYQIFRGTLQESTNGEHLLSVSEWGSGVDTTKLDDLREELNKKATTSTTGFPLNSIAPGAIADGVRELYTNENAHEFAEIISKYLSNTVYKSVESSLGETVIEIDDPGYYFVKDKDNSLHDDSGNAITPGTAYSRYMIRVAGNAKVDVKASAPTVIKKVKENSALTGNVGAHDTKIPEYTLGTGYNDVADYSIGDMVPFQLIGTVPSTYVGYTTYKYAFHDTLAKGLELDPESIEVRIRHSGNDSEPILAGQDTYSVKPVTTNEDDSTSFSIEFADLKKFPSDKLNSGSMIIVNYNARLTEKATIGSNGNENKVYLTFSNNPNAGGEGNLGRTPEDKVVVFTFKLDLVKKNAQSVDGVHNTLSGAKFKLSRKSDGRWLHYHYDEKNEKNVVIWINDETQASEVTSGEDGSFSFTGLDGGHYLLHETQAPTGFHRLVQPIEFNIVPTLEYTQDYDGVASNAISKLVLGLIGTFQDVAEAGSDGNVSTGVVTMNVFNSNTGALPVTGGIGTTIFYVVGSILAIGAAILLIVKKRMGNEE